MELTTDSGRRTRWTTLRHDLDDRPDAWSHSGAAIAADGRLVVAQRGGGGVALIDEATGAVERIATPTAECHGILSEPSIDPGTLWIADPGGQVLALDVATRSTRRIRRPGIPAGESERWAPTSLAIVTAGPHRGDLWIADGYGESLVHLVRPDGSSLTIDGSESGAAFDCPHGVAVDTRGGEPIIVVADRGNRRLVWFDLDGSFVRALEDPVMTSPSSIAVRGAELLVTDLFGALLAVDPADRVTAIIPIDPATHSRPGWPNDERDGGAARRPALVDGILNSPHGIAVRDDGTVYLTEWVIGGRETRLELDGQRQATSSFRAASDAVPSTVRSASR
ncbi:MAG: repeat-containing protein [Microbacteriaceae bacterium]|nr:repeat-containing protein [Microbacteriaceae bacterium]